MMTTLYGYCGEKLVKTPYAPMIELYNYNYFPNILAKKLSIWDKPSYIKHTYKK